MPQNTPKILIISSDTGGGHRSAAQALAERRQEVADGCFCTHESNSYYPSLPFNPKHLIQIKKLEKQMKKASKSLDLSKPQTEGVAVKV